MNRSQAECEFCLDHYAEDSCQFYRPRSEFLVTTVRNGRLILCECCDHSDNEHAHNDDGEHSSDPHGSPAIATASDTDELSSDAKRAKLDANNEREPVKIQPGWYGKGYRKQTKRRKKKSYNMP